MQKFEGRADRSRLLERGWRALAALVVTAAVMVPLAAPSAHAAATGVPTGPGTTVTPSDWTSAGGNADDTHDAATEKAIGTGNVRDLREKWSYTTTGDVTATPIVVHGTVYVPDWGGSLSAVAAGTGAKLWSYPVSDYTGVPGDLSRTSSAYWKGETVEHAGRQRPELVYHRITRDQQRDRLRGRVLA